MSQCPCGSGKSFSACCEPYLTGAADAPTAEALMRSRYTAYTLNKTAYIESSHDPETRDSLDLEATGRWAGESEWLGLKILRTEAGGKKDDRGIVEFEALALPDPHRPLDPVEGAPGQLPGPFPQAPSCERSISSGAANLEKLSLR